MKKLLILSLATTLLLTGCAEMFQGKVDMTPSTGGLSGLLSEKAVIAKLSPPAQLNVTKGDSSSYIDLNWSEVEGAITYRLERAVEAPADDGSFFSAATASQEEQESFFKNLAFEEIQASWYTNTYRDDTVKDTGVRYWYRVTAENNRDKVAPDPSDPSEASYGCLFSVAKGVTADLGLFQDKVTVRWNKVEYATSYEIYRGTDSSGAGAVYLDSVTADRLQYTNKIAADDQGKEFYYIVRAVNRIGHRSDNSSVAMGFALVAGAPVPPQNVAVEEGRGRGDSTDSIAIKWDAVPGDGDVTYNIYRTSNEDSSLYLVDTVKNDTTYVDKRALKTGVYYYYQIQSSVLDDEGTELKSKFSDSGQYNEKGELNADAAEGYLLSATKSLTANKEDGNITLTWLPSIGNPEEQKRYSYKVLVDSDQNGAFSTVLDTIGPDVSPDEDGFISKQVETHSFYKLVTVNGSLESAPSIVVAATPDAAENASVTKAANVGGNANDNGVYPVKITWSKPSNDTPAGYHVYRSTASDGSYRKITDEPVTATEYIDNNDTAKAGKRFWYKVLSVNSLGQGSHYSEPVQGYGALTHEEYLIEFNKPVVSAQKKLSLMHKPGSTEKLGSETISGNISGTLSYDAQIAGLGARIIMRYTKLAEFYIDGDAANGPYFELSGESNTSANMSSNGDMDGTVTATGMYPGKVSYDGVQIKGGAAGGGTYGVEPNGFGRVEVPYTVIN